MLPPTRAVYKPEMHPGGISLFPASILHTCHLLDKPLYSGSPRKHISVLQLTQYLWLMLDHYRPPCWWMLMLLLLFTESMLRPGSELSLRLGVRGSVCQMAQQAGRPAARGAQEEIRAAGGGGGGERRGLLSLQSLCSAQLKCSVM